MSDAIKHIDVDSDEFEDAPKALRDYVKKLQRHNETIQSENDGYRQAKVAQAVSEVLADKGFKNPKRVERDLLADSVDPLDSSAVERWLSENSDDYARTESAPVAEPVQQADPIEQSAFEAVAGLNLQPAGNRDAYAAAAAELTPDMTPAQVREVYLKHGA